MQARVIGFTGQERYGVVHTARGRVIVAYVFMGLQCCSFVFGFRDLLWVLQGQGFIFGALCPSKSGLPVPVMHKHTVKHTYRGKEGCQVPAMNSESLTETIVL